MDLIEISIKKKKESLTTEIHFSESNRVFSETSWNLTKGLDDKE